MSTPKTAMLGIRVTPQQRARYMSTAQRAGVSLSEMVREMLNERAKRMGIELVGWNIDLIAKIAQSIEERDVESALELLDELDQKLASMLWAASDARLETGRLQEEAIQKLISITEALGHSEGE